MIAPLNLEELYSLPPSDTILLIQYLDRVLGIGQICFEQCHFWLLHPRVLSDTSLVVTHGRCHELLPMTVVIKACIPRSHTSQG
jgi:hypothetical protein